MSSGEDGPRARRAYGRCGRAGTGGAASWWCQRRYGHGASRRQHGSPTAEVIAVVRRARHRVRRAGRFPSGRRHSLEREAADGALYAGGREVANGFPPGHAGPACGLFRGVARLGSEPCAGHSGPCPAPPEAAIPRMTSQGRP